MKKKQVQLIASGDLRASANQVCWPAQLAMEGALSRAVAGIRGQVIILNLPGSPKGAVESLDAVADLLPHAAEVIRGASHD